jgi:hypothetical protein
MLSASRAVIRAYEGRLDATPLRGHRTGAVRFRESRGRAITKRSC